MVSPGTDGIVSWTCTRIQLMDALRSLPLTRHMHLEALGGLADSVLEGLPEAPAGLTEDQAREIMQQQVEAEKPRLLAEVAAATDERLEQSMLLVRRAIAAAIFAQKQPCPDHPMPLPKPSCWTCGRNGAFERAARIALGESHEGWAKP